MESLQDDPKASKYSGVMVGIPTFGMVSINFCVTLATTGSPIFTSKAWLPIIGKPVDVARNEIAKVALDRGYAYVWFRDDDVTTEHDALVKLFGRLTKEQRSNPREVGDMVVGGVVYSKIKPPSPMIYRAGIPGGYEDWNFGDLVECDAIGMGATLIPIGVFNKILEKGIDKFQCVNDGCAVNWKETYKEMGNCPHCGIELCPVFFRTIRGGDGLDFRPVEMTEDTYFCLLAKDAGAKIYADCGVQCQHECTQTGTIFYFHEGMGFPVWECEGDIEFWPKAETMVAKAKEFDPRGKEFKKNNGKVKFNLGSGGVNKKGFINIDLYEKADYKCDVRDLGPVVRTFGQADLINANHLLEHINRGAVTTSVKNWLKALKPGGVLKIEVPDSVWTMQNFIKADGNGASTHEKIAAEAYVYGRQENPGDMHLSGLTENKMKDIMASCQNQLEGFSVRALKPKGYNQKVIRVRAVKKKEKVA